MPSQIIEIKEHSSSSWHEVQLPEDVREEDILRSICAVLLPTRYTGPVQDGQRIEIFCTTPEELARAEAHLRQAMADQKLRREIETRSSDRITQIVDAVICRVSGK